MCGDGDHDVDNSDCHYNILVVDFVVLIVADIVVIPLAVRLPFPSFIIIAIYTFNTTHASSQTGFSRSRGGMAPQRRLSQGGGLAKEVA